MQLNQALFLLGGGSGYVPQPDAMRDDPFDPFDKETLRVEPITVQLQVRPTNRSVLSRSGCSLMLKIKNIKFSVRCWGRATCPKTAGASFVLSWRWKSAARTTTAASARRTSLVSRRPRTFGCFSPSGCALTFLLLLAPPS